MSARKSSSNSTEWVLIYLAQNPNMPVGFTDYEPSGVSGYRSDIAKPFGKSDGETDNLLDAIVTLEREGRIDVDRRERPWGEGEASLEAPKRYKVVVTLA